LENGRVGSISKMSGKRDEVQPSVYHRPDNSDDFPILWPTINEIPKKHGMAARITVAPCTISLAVSKFAKGTNELLCLPVNVRNYVIQVIFLCNLFQIYPTGTSKTSRINSK
jgi:hypothetical protein